MAESEASWSVPILKWCGSWRSAGDWQEAAAWIHCLLRPGESGLVAGSCWRAQCCCTTGQAKSIQPKILSARQDVWDFWGKNPSICLNLILWENRNAAWPSRHSVFFFSGKITLAFSSSPGSKKWWEQQGEEPLTPRWEEWHSMMSSLCVSACVYPGI